jgi:hypothetical protein
MTTETDWRFIAWLLALALFVSVSANLAFYLLLAN